MDEREDTDFVCALGLPLGIEGIIQQGKSSDGYIALNGCPVKCASKALKNADIPVTEEIVITERFGVQKNKNLTSEEKLEDIIAEVQRMVDEMQKDS